MRRTQFAAYWAAEQPVLSELRVDHRPESQRTAAGRFLEPYLFND
jgi:hypothetical protein